VQYSGVTWAVYAKSLRTGRVYLLDGWRREGAMAADLYFPIISLWGGRLAWSFVVCFKHCGSAQEDLTAAVLTESLPAGRREIVRRTYGRCAADWPSVWGSLVVYQMEGYCWGRDDSRVGSDVIAEDLAAHKTWAVTTNHGSSEPVTNGRYIAWKEAAAGATRWKDGAIMLLDRVTGKRGPVSLRTTGRNHPACWPRDTRVETCADQPEISSQVLEWTIDNGGAVLAKDLATGNEYYFSVPLGSHHLATRPLCVSGRHVVWRDIQTGANGSTRGSDVAVGTVP
jgi:hypothetical protein